MVRDAKKLELATHYRKLGYSYSEISKICGISKATISAWLGKKAFSKSVKQENIAKAGKANASRLRLLNKAKAKERDKRYQEALKSAKTEYRHYRTNPLFTAGLMLYLANGAKTNRSLIRFTTSSQEEHRIFRKFAHTYLGATKFSIKFWLLLNSNQNETESIKFWTKTLKLTTAQCYKHQVIQTDKKESSLQSGTGNTIIGNTVMKIKLLCWIELATKDL